MHMPWRLALVSGNPFLVVVYVTVVALIRLHRRLSAMFEMEVDEFNLVVRLYVASICATLLVLAVVIAET
jgi:hypothetical protein